MQYLKLVKCKTEITETLMILNFLEKTKKKIIRNLYPGVIRLSPKSSPEIRVLQIKIYKLKPV